MPDPRSARPDYPAMTDAELRIARDSLGVTGDWLAARLHVDARTYRRWEQGAFQIPPGVATEIRALQDQAAECVAAEIGKQAGIEMPVLYTYRSDEDYRAANPDGAHCAGWHRAVAARVKAAVPRLVVAFYARPPRLEGELAGQLADVMGGVFIDAAARSAPREFLLGEIEDCLDDATGKTAYPELLAVAHTWSASQAAAVVDGLGHGAPPTRSVAAPRRCAPSA